MKREGFEVARCTVQRLMKQIGIRGAVRGKVVKTTVPDTSVPCPRDKVNRIFRATASTKPNWSIAKGPGATCRIWKWRHSAGSTGLTTGGCLDP
jgi:hypothetical protein